MGEMYKRKSVSIANKMVVPVILILLIQSALFLAVMVHGGLLDQLHHNATEILDQRVVNRRNDMEREIQNRWTNINDSARALQNTFELFLKNSDLGVQEVMRDERMTTELLEQFSPDLIYLIRRQTVSGAFLVLNRAPDVGEASDFFRPGLYLRNLHPLQEEADNSDLSIERGPSTIMHRTGIPVSRSWYPTFRFGNSSTISNDNYFNKPYYAALHYPELSNQELAYWSPPFRLCGGDLDVITYSMPLRTKDNQVFGILGIELSCNYLRSLLPYTELGPSGNGAYLLAMNREGSMDFDHLLSNGPSASMVLEDDKFFLSLDPSTISKDPDLVYKILNPHNNLELFACLHYLNLYAETSPFQAERWYLIGVMDAQNLFNFSKLITRTIVIDVFITLLIGVGGVLLMGRIVTHPITQLIHEVRSSNPHLPLRFKRIRINEIDELATAVESLSREVAESASRMSSIIEMTSSNIGAFERRLSEGIVYYTSHLFDLFGISVGNGTSGYMEFAQFTTLMHSLPLTVEEPSSEREVVVRRKDEEGELHWIRIKQGQSPGRVFGIAEDITHDVLARQKLVYERDHDPMTGLLNRRAFYASLSAMFERPQLLKVGAMVMCDLDNLKYINDTYGHDYGDQYIREMANALIQHAPSPRVLARLSGDEFYFFSYGAEDRETLFQQICKMKQEIDSILMPLPDNPNFRLRSSAGISWFPDDSQTYDQLMHYADFSMYTAKHTSKGELREFNMHDYMQESYLIYNNEELNRLLDENLLTYDFQPIVDAASGKVFGYEALMRSQLPTLPSTDEILSLARAQSKLHLIERRTWQNALKGFSELPERVDDCYLFINSLPNQILSPEIVRELEKRYPDLLHRIVIELTEKEPQNDRYMRDKLQLAQKWGAKIALDGFGAGYSNDDMLLQIEPDFIKINMKLIRDIDIDTKHHQFLESILSYTKERGIRSIAEGIETSTEMETLIRSGVDYLQGFYIGRPEAGSSEIAPSICEEIHSINCQSPEP